MDDMKRLSALYGDPMTNYKQLEEGWTETPKAKRPSSPKKSPEKAGAPDPKREDATQLQELWKWRTILVRSLPLTPCSRGPPLTPSGPRRCSR